MNKIDYKYELDSVRGFAVLIVCIAHFYTIDESALLATNYYFGIITFKLSSLGTSGVELFFVLSGFLITRILLNSKSSKNYFFNFYTRRFLRIFPLYYFALFLGLIIFPIFFNTSTEGNIVLENQWKLWFYISNTHFINYVNWDVELFPNFGHFWSLSVEEHFYLLWPFLIYYVKESKLLKVMVGIFILSIFSWYLKIYIEFFSWSTINYSAALSVGGIIAYYEKFNPDFLKRIYKSLSKYFLVIVILFLILAFTPRSLGEIRDFILFIFSLLTFVSLLLIALYNKNTNNIFFNSSFLKYTGKISYGIYVYHALLRPFYKEYIYYEFLQTFDNINSIILILIYTLVSILISYFIAWISWNFFESKILIFKKKFEDVKLKGNK